MSKIKIEEIQAELKKENWKLISEVYENLDSELVYECSEGHRIYAPWKKIRQKKECPICEQNKLKNLDTKTIPKEKNKKRFLALDQSTRITGWSIYDGTQLKKYGVFETSLSDEIARDNALKNWLISIINSWKPDYIGIEGIQLQEKSEQRRMGVTVFETLARLQGILLDTCYEYKIPYKICPTNTWRSHCKVRGKTRADKERSMQLLVKEWFDISISNDEADAIGIGKFISDTIGKEVKMENWE